MTQEISGPEAPRRKWDRLDYQSDMALVLEDGGRYEGHTRDVGLGGVFLTVKDGGVDPALVGARGELWVLPARDGVTFPCRVIRVDDDGIGVAFDDRQAAFGMFVTHDMLLSLLTGINNSFANSLDLEASLKTGVMHIKDYLQSEAASLFLLDDDEKNLVCRACSGPVDITGLTLEKGEGIVGKVVASGAPLVIHDVSQDPDFAVKVDQATGFTTRSILCAPLIIQGHVLGALEVLNKRGSTLFEGHDQLVLTALASATAMAVHNATMAEKLKRDVVTGKEVKFRSMVECAGDSIFIHDRYGRMYDVNQAACDGLGYTREELMALTVADLEASLPFDGLRETWDLGEADPEKYPLSLQGAHRRKDGSVFPMEVRLGLLPDEGQNLFIAIVRDTSEREAVAASLQAAKEKAEAASALKDKFVSLVAHDLRGPIGTIVGLLELLLDGKDQLPPDAAEMIALVADQGRSIGRVVEELLDLSRLKTGKITPRSRFLSVRDETERGLSMVRAVADRKGVALVNDMPETGRLYADQTLFGQVLQNLLSNAIKFTSAGNEIRLWQPAGRPSVVAVSDNGVGIPEKNLSRLFRIEEKVSTTGTAGERGTGFGLPLSREIIIAHGGDLTVQSVEGEGSTFFIELPDVKPRVLVVDDEDMQRVLLSAQVAQLGAEVAEAEDGVRALEILRASKPFDLVISDIVMPGLDGFGLLREMRADPTTEGVPVILATGDEKVETRDHAFRAGAIDYITKPIDPNDLVPRIRRIIY